MSEESKPAIQFADLEIPVQKVSKARKSGKDLQAIADELGVNPFEILLQAAAGDFASLGYSAAEVIRLTPQGDSFMEEILPMSLRVTAAKEAAQYLHPKKRAIEVSGDSENPLNLTFQGDLFDLVKQSRRKSV